MGRGISPGASLTWDTINWSVVEKHVRRLQVRIAKAVREGRHGKAKSLQWILSHSFYAKLQAVKRVTQNKGWAQTELKRWNSYFQENKKTVDTIFCKISKNSSTFNAAVIHALSPTPTALSVIDTAYAYRPLSEK